MLKKTLRTLLLTTLVAGATHVADAQCYLAECNPVSGSTVTELSSVKMTWLTSSGGYPEYGQNFNSNNDERRIDLYKDGEKVGTAHFQSDYSTWSDPFMRFTGYVIVMEVIDSWGDHVSGSYTDPGTYSLTIPANAFSEKENEDVNGNEPTTLSWTIGGGANPTGGACYLADSDPKNNATVDLLDKVRFNFLTPSGSRAYASTNFWTWSNRQIEVKDASGTTVKTLPLQETSGDTEYNFVLYFENFAKPGKYTFTIPAGLVSSVDGGEADLNEAVTLSYTIKAQSGGEGNLTYDFEFDMESVTPKQGDIRWDAFQTLETINISSIPVSLRLNPAVYPYVITPEGDEIEASLVTTGANVGVGNQLIFGFDGADMWKSGDYTIVIPRNCVGTPEWAASGYSDGSCNEELKLRYTYTGNPLYDNNDDDDDDDTPFEVIYARLKTGGTTYDLTTSQDRENPALRLPTLHPSSIYTFKTNKNDKCRDAYFTVTDLTIDEVIWLAGSYPQQVTSETDIQMINGKNSDDAFEMKSNPNIPFDLIEGHIYEVKMEVYKQYDGVPEALKPSMKRGEANYYIAGTTPGYQYGDAQIVSITPNPSNGEITSTDNARFTIVFDKPVEMNSTYTKVQGSTSWLDYEVCETNDGGYTWEFKIPASAVAAAPGELNCRFAPRQEGQAVWYEEGSFGIKSLYSSGQKNDTYQTITFNCFLGGASISVDPEDGATVTSLSTFKFTAPSASHKNIGFQGVANSGARLYGILYNAKGEEAARLLTEPDDYENQPSGEYNISVTMHLDKTVNINGEYTLEIPGAFFMTGTESTAKGNAPVTFHYTIAGGVDPVVKETCTFTYIIDGHSAVSHEVKKGSKVTVKINPTENFMIDELTLNGETQAINGNRYMTPELNDDEAVLNLTHKYVGDAYFDFSTGVETITGCDYSVVNVEDGIKITGLSGGEDVYVFNAAGMEIANKTNGSHNTVTISLEPGIYIIVVDGTALKVKH